MFADSSDPHNCYPFLKGRASQVRWLVQPLLETWLEFQVAGPAGAERASMVLQHVQAQPLLTAWMGQLGLLCGVLRLVILFVVLS